MPTPFAATQRPARRSPPRVVLALAGLALAASLPTRAQTMLHNEFEYDPGRSFRAWLKTVTLNRWRDGLRRQAVAPRGGNGAALDEAPAPGGPDDFSEAEYRRHLVGRALALMRSEFRPATWRACWGGGCPARR